MVVISIETHADEATNRSTSSGRPSAEDREHTLISGETGKDQVSFVYPNNDTNIIHTDISS
jgi:hypothetical protein